MNRGGADGSAILKALRALRLQSPRLLMDSTQIAQDDFFDAEFLSELEELANAGSGHPLGTAEVPDPLHRKLSALLATDGGAGVLDEEAFVGLLSHDLTEFTNRLVECCREGGRQDASRAVENFIVFFQALVPTLAPEGAAAIGRVFFRLIPTLLHIAYNDFSTSHDSRRDGLEALRNLERVLTEISSIRLAPMESELIFRSIDQMTSFIGVGEYSMANDVISSQLLSIIERNKLQRALFRLMEAEVAVQRYLKERLGYTTPRIRLPEDVEALADYAPIRIFDEEGLDGARRRLIEIQLPHIPLLSDVVISLVGEESSEHYEMRLDALGSTELDVPDDTYRLGLAYEPRE